MLVDWDDQVSISLMHNPMTLELDYVKLVAVILISIWVLGHGFDLFHSSIEKLLHLLILVKFGIPGTWWYLHLEINRNIWLELPPSSSKVHSAELFKVHQLIYDLLVLLFTRRLILNHAAECYQHAFFLAFPQQLQLLLGPQSFVNLSDVHIRL